MRIDRSDPADEPGDARRAQPAPDDPDAAARDHGNVAGGDGPRSSSPSPLDAALRTERAAAFLAAIHAAYRQHAIDDGNTRVQEPERETVTPTLRPIEENRFAEATPVLARSANGLGYPAVATAADHVQTGARGRASGRDFDPESAGGPIQQLDAGKARITDEGVQDVAAHLRRFTGGGSLDAPEQGMLDRLTSIAAGDMEPTSYDLNFFTHEQDEAGRYARLGFGPESDVDLGSSEMYEVWNDVHTAALEDYGISDAGLFHPGLPS